jgi:hypothetical protein
VEEEGAKRYGGVALRVSIPCASQGTERNRTSQQLGGCLPLSHSRSLLTGRSHANNFFFALAACLLQQLPLPVRASTITMSRERAPNRSGPIIRREGPQLVTSVRGVWAGKVNATAPPHAVCFFVPTFEFPTLSSWFLGRGDDSEMQETQDFIVSKHQASNETVTKKKYW